MACNQTHVAVLQELCVKRKWGPPVYEDVYSGGSPNDPIFHIQVTLPNGVFAKGVGRQKKAAKHDAAKKALQILDVPALTDGTASPVKPKTQFDHLLNPHEDFSGNAIGELTEMCISKHLPAPQFVLIGDEGEPHEKTFTYKCTVSSLHEKGVARKKQAAKHLAALNMIKNLKTNFKDYVEPQTDKTPKGEVSPGTDERDALVINKYKEIKQSDFMIPALDHGLMIKNYHLAYKEKLANFNEIMASPNICREHDPFQKLHLVAEALNHKISTAVTVCKKSNCHLVFIMMDMVPSAVQSGMHLNIEEAEKLAAIALLEFLTVMAQ